MRRVAAKAWETANKKRAEDELEQIVQIGLHDEALREAVRLQHIVVAAETLVLDQERVPTAA